MDELADLLLGRSHDARMAVSGVDHADARREVQQLLTCTRTINIFFFELEKNELKLIAIFLLIKY